MTSVDSQPWRQTLPAALQATPRRGELIVSSEARYSAAAALRKRMRRTDVRVVLRPPTPHGGPWYEVRHNREGMVEVHLLDEEGYTTERGSIPADGVLCLQGQRVPAPVVALARTWDKPGPAYIAADGTHLNMYKLPLQLGEQLTGNAAA